MSKAAWGPTRFRGVTSMDWSTELLRRREKFADNPCPRDWEMQATLLHQLGVDHRMLSYLHHGRDETATD